MVAGGIARRRLVAMMAIVATLGFVHPSGATALNWGSQGTAGIAGITNGVWLSDSNIWYVAKRGLTVTYANGVQATLNASYIPTDLVVSTFTPSSCPDAAYDVCVYDNDYGDNGLNGWNACAGSTVGAHPNQKCTLDWVRINQHYSPPAQRIACHELAHTLGLRHTGEQASCVKRTADGGNSAVLSDHDKFLLNGQY